MDHIDYVTCLGCGLACDDIGVSTTGGAITEARNACTLGVAWFGDGRQSTKARVGTAEVEWGPAVVEAAKVLRSGARPLVYLAPNMANDVYAAAAGAADLLHALLDSVTTAGAPGGGVLAAQARGRTTATYTEIRNRADTLVFWGVDPAARYPRFQSRITPGPTSMFGTVRTVIAVDIGSAKGPADAAKRVAFSVEEEGVALALTRAAIVGHAVTSQLPAAARAAGLAKLLTAGKYVAIVVDGETTTEQEALLWLSEALNGPTRAALITLRGGGNRVGADTVLTWQTGFPMAVDFARGVPRYVPQDGAVERLARGAIDVALVVGSLDAAPAAVRDGLARVTTVVIGPKATASKAQVAIDTGVAGINDQGGAVRADDMPVRLRAPLGSGDSAGLKMQMLLGKLVAR
jgi:formylmethanofuran dehydrogenase subunit B